MMSTTVAIRAVGLELQGSVPSRPRTEDVSGQAAGDNPAAESADLRLVIEEDKAANSFVYKTVDLRTGRVIQQFPREEVLRLKASPDYTPGAVVSARSYVDGFIATAPSVAWIVVPKGAERSTPTSPL